MHDVIRAQAQSELLEIMLLTTVCMHTHAWSIRRATHGMQHQFSCYWPCTCTPVD